MSRGADTRARLLAAAAAVVRGGGPGALTLDAVATHAGVSKGGLLYHFPTKEALVDGLLEHWMTRFEADVAAAVEPGPGGWTRAFVRASDTTALPPDEQFSEAALLALLVAEPDRLGVVRARYAAWQERISADGVDAADATVARLAADGLWLADLLGLAPPALALRRRVHERLAKLAS